MTKDRLAALKAVRFIQWTSLYSLGVHFWIGISDHDCFVFFTLLMEYCLAINYRRVPIIARQNSNRHNLTKSTSQVSSK